MISAGGNTIGQKGQEFLCGRSWDEPGYPSVADTSCEDKVGQLYNQYTAGLMENERQIFDDSFNIVYGSIYDSCFIKETIGVDPSDAEIGRHARCTIGYVTGSSIVSFEGKRSFEDTMKYLHERTKGLVGIDVAMVALPFEFRTYLQGLRAKAKGSPYLKLANQAERLFREALAQVDSKDRAAAALEIGKAVQTWAIWHEGEIKDASNKTAALVEPVSTYVYKVDKTNAHVVDNSFIPEFKVAPKELFDTGALGFGSGVTLPLRARAELRRLFVEALIELREVKGNENLVLLATKTADAVKDLKEDDDKIGDLGYRLIGVTVKKVLLKGNDVDRVVLKMRATIADTPYKLLHLFDNRVGPSYVPLMRHALADLWDMVAEEVGASKLRRNTKLKKRLADDLINRSKIDKLSPTEFFRLIVVSVDEGNGRVKLTRVPEVLFGLALRPLAVMFGSYGVFRKLKKHYAKALKEAKDMEKNPYDGNSPAAKQAQAKLALQISNAAKKVIQADDDMSIGVGKYAGTVEYSGLDDKGNFKEYFVPPTDSTIAVSGDGSTMLKLDAHFIGGYVTEDIRRNDQAGQALGIGSLEFQHKFSGGFYVGAKLRSLFGIFAEMLAEPRGGDSMQLEEGNAGAVHFIQEGWAQLGYEGGPFSIGLAGGITSKRGQSVGSGLGNSELWFGPLTTVGPSRSWGGRLDLGLKLLDKRLGIGGTFAMNVYKGGIFYDNVSDKPQEDIHVFDEGGMVISGSVYLIAEAVKNWLKIGAAYHGATGEGQQLHTIDSRVAIPFGEEEGTGQLLEVFYRRNMLSQEQDADFDQDIAGLRYEGRWFKNDWLEIRGEVIATYMQKGGELTGLPPGLGAWAPDIPLANEALELTAKPTFIFRTGKMFNGGIYVQPVGSFIMSRQGKGDFEGDGSWVRGFYVGGNFGVRHDILSR